VEKRGLTKAGQWAVRSRIAILKTPNAAQGICHVTRERKKRKSAVESHASLKKKSPKGKMA